MKNFSIKDFLLILTLLMTLSCVAGCNKAPADEANTSEETTTEGETSTEQTVIGEKMTTMTFNIRNWDLSGDHLYRIKKTINQYTPDVIGFQEMSNLQGYQWVDRLFKDEKIAATYEYVGEDRKDGTGEQCAIFFRKDKFTLSKTETRWLYCKHGIKCTSSECIGETTPGNFAGDYFRIMTYARLKRISDGKEITFINTHLDGSAKHEGVVKQTKQVDYILNFARSLTDSGETVVLVGDFNATLESEACKKVLDAGFKCAEKESENFVGEELADGEKYLSQDSPMYGRIDHIFIKSSTDCIFDTYTYCNKKITYKGEADYPSDHIPRIATFIV